MLTGRSSSAVVGSASPKYGGGEKRGRRVNHPPGNRPARSGSTRGAKRGGTRRVGGGEGGVSPPWPAAGAGARPGRPTTRQSEGSSAPSRQTATPPAPNAFAADDWL